MRKDPRFVIYIVGEITQDIGPVRPVFIERSMTVERMRDQFSIAYDGSGQLEIPEPSDGIISVEINVPIDPNSKNVW